MGYAEKRGTYWRARYKLPDGRYGTVTDESGAGIRFRTKRAAEQAANDAEARVREANQRPSLGGPMLFGTYVDTWFARLDLAPSTMQNYRRHLEDHLLPAFGERNLADITDADIAVWEQRERAVGYAASSIRTWRGTLHLVLADAQEDGWIAANPAARRANRGKRAGRSRDRGPEKAITAALGVLLIAERAALMSGRDDEFVQVVWTGFSGSRWGEVIGLETQFVRPAAVRIEWQLYELDSGELVKCPPKDDSYRTLAVPGWLLSMLREHITRKAPKPCACHGFTYVFDGHRPPNTSARRVGPKLADVARLAGVSIGTASDFLHHPGRVAAGTQERITAAIAELGYTRAVEPATTAAHHRRSGFATWVFQPAATGRFPAKAPRPARPVPILSDPWPGVPVRGRGGMDRATACWLPIAPDLTPHGLRHSYKTMMVEMGIPAVLMDTQLGHMDGSIQGRYSHVTAEMTARLLEGLTARWQEALEARRRMHPRSPVRVLDRLLRGSGQDRLPEFSQEGQ
ncbi:LacI family DNA-binding transcriptional regulator [Dactylosporangium sp. NPDC000521]|uniref:LacI family DNA-binding transcriptional regulator n=1 Tax=Dactylosporangium sp. NPDC000521 TaxID=3363975 RepID=UPI0036D0DE86